MKHATRSSVPMMSMSEWVLEYRPKCIELTIWLEVRSFVASAATDLSLRPSSGSFRTIRAIALLSAWGLMEGVPLEAEALLDPLMVDRFVAVGLVGERSQATYRSVLRRVGPLLTDWAPWEPKPISLARRQVAVPYGEAELTALRADAKVQPTPGRLRAARALLALGCGAGLDGRWVARVGSEDVVESSWGVLVRVEEPSARVVPVLATWEEEVLELAASASGEFLVGGRSTSRNRAGALAASLVVAEGRPRFSASRLRSTWLLTHLSNGTRLPELAQAAGLAGVTVLSDLLPFVPSISQERATAMLRGRK